MLSHFIHVLLFVTPWTVAHLGSTPGWGSRSHMSQLRIHVLQIRPRAGRINKENADESLHSLPWLKIVLTILCTNAIRMTGRLIRSHYNCLKTVTQNTPPSLNTDCTQIWLKDMESGWWNHFHIQSNCFLEILLNWWYILQWYLKINIQYYLIWLLSSMK